MNKNGLATLDDLRESPSPIRKTSVKKLMVLSKENIAARKSRELGTSNIIVSGQSPLTESDIRPHMPVHEKAAHAAVGYVHDSMKHISKKFSGVRLYALAEEAVKKSVENISVAVFEESAAKELANMLMRNMGAHQIFSEKLTRVRKATLERDTNALVGELLEFAKFFDGNLWGKMNVVSEMLWNKTGFAVGKFTTDYHLKWMALLKDPFVRSVMASVAEAAKSLASYKTIEADFFKKRKAIESEIGKAPVLEKLRKELHELHEQHQAALKKCDEIRSRLCENKNNPKSATPVSENDVEKVRATANDLDYQLEQAVTRYTVAIDSVLTADENADAARLAGMAIQMHIVAVARLFFVAGRFVLSAGDFFIVQSLLGAADHASQLVKQGKNVTSAHGVGSDINRLSEKTKGGVDADKEVLPDKTLHVGVAREQKARAEVKTAMSNLDKQVSVKVRDKQTGEERIELIWITFEITSSPKTCTACSENIPEETTIARPHYPCLPYYPGEPEVIHDGQRTVVAGAYICHACVSESLAKLNELQNSGEWQYEPEKTYVRKIERAV